MQSLKKEHGANLGLIFVSAHILRSNSECFILLYLLLFEGTKQGIGIGHAQREGDTRAAVRLGHNDLLVLQLPDLLS